MAGPFDYFVIFAEMRTGSNFLEANLNAFDSFESYGEAFNPHFIGYPNKDEIAGVTRAQRDANPMSLIGAIKDKPDGLGGFRFFYDHDGRVIDPVLNDPRCAKIILTRNPVDSYVSWKIAQATGQWKLTNVKQRKDSTIRFNKAEFEKHVTKLQEFQVLLLNRLQKSGQAAFYIAYEDLQDLDVLNGLARFLGSEERLEALDASLKKQNPSALEDKVSNFKDMERAFSGLDPFNLTRTPNFEPRRGAAVPGFVTGAHASLLYMPIRSGPKAEVCAWLAGLDGVKVEDLPTKLTQKGLRQWKRRKPGHRSFTVLRHPVARAHAAFCDKILQTGPSSYADIRKTLRNFHKLPIPGKMPDDGYDLKAHRAAFLAFLEFLGSNVAGRTDRRMAPCGATRTAVMQGMAGFASPDWVVREDDMQEVLQRLAQEQGYLDAAQPKPAGCDTPFSLADVYTSKIEKLVSDVYQRDYMMFGFKSWA